METVGFVEIDKYCQKVLRKHWPGVKIISDIHDVKEDTFEAVDIITGGFPCQPFSVAGKRKGTDDDRYLWPAMLEVIKAYQPTWVIGENVAGIIGMALEQVLSELENAGYETQAFVIPACAVNAPHRRDRVWIIAHANGKLGISPQERLYKVRLPHSLDAQGFRLRECQSPILGDNDGIPNRVDRLKSLGNAIVPQVAYEILNNLLLAGER